MSKETLQQPLIATNVYKELIPYLAALNNISYLTDENKKERAIDFSVEILTKALNKYNETIKENEKPEFTRDFIIKARNIMTAKDDISQIIYYMQCATKAN